MKVDQHHRAQLHALPRVRTATVRRHGFLHFVKFSRSYQNTTSSNDFLVIAYQHCRCMCGRGGRAMQSRDRYK